MKAIGPYLIEGYTSGEEIYKQVYDSNFQTLSKIKLPKIPKFLGSGLHGYAISIGNKKIMKITDDLSEAKASSLISKKSLPGVWKIDSVWKFGKQKVWIIIGEQLKTDRAKARVILKVLKEAFINLGINQDKEDAYEEISRSYEDKALPDILMEIGGSKGATEIAYGMNALHNAGIKFFDLHAGNILFRGNKPVIVDLGESVSGFGKIGIFECHIKKI